MTDKIQSKPVREARAKARKMARDGIAGYRQSLDIVAREEGHQHWNAFASAHETDLQSADDQARVATGTPAIAKRGWGPISLLKEMASVSENEDKGWIEYHFVNGSATVLLGLALFLWIALSVRNDPGNAGMIVVAIVFGLVGAAPGIAQWVAGFRLMRIVRRRRRQAEGAI